MGDQHKRLVDRLREQDRCPPNGKIDPPLPSGIEPWEPPIPLDAIPDAAPFPVAILPTPFRRLVEEGSVALPCPPDYIAVPILVMAGGYIAATRALAIKQGHVQRASLFAAVIGPPGSTKTPAQELVVEPAHDEGERLRDAWKQDMEEYERASARYEEAKNQAKQSGTEPPDKPRRPTLARLTVSDTTVEGLAPILEENPRGVVVVRDELIGWVQGMNQYREGGRGSDQQFWLSAWSGTTIEIDREKTHEKGPIVIRRPFISVVGGLTPHKLPTLRGLLPRQPAEQDGFLDRILMSYPVPLSATPENWMEVSPETLNDYRACLANLRELEMTPMQDGAGIKGWRSFVVRLTGDGRRAWQRFTQEHADELNAPDFPPFFKGPWSKFRGYCARLALIAHFMRWSAREADADDVDGEDVGRAVTLIRYFKSHARKVYSLMDADHRIKEAKRVLAWLTGPNSVNSVNSVKGLQGKVVSRRNVHVGVWGGSKTVEEVDPVLRLLSEHGYLRELNAMPHPGRGRKPSDCYEVSPFLTEELSRNSQIHEIPQVEGRSDESDARHFS